MQNDISAESIHAATAVSPRLDCGETTVPPAKAKGTRSRMRGLFFVCALKLVDSVIRCANVRPRPSVLRPEEGCHEGDLPILQLAPRLRNVVNRE